MAGVGRGPVCAGELATISAGLSPTQLSWRDGVGGGGCEGPFEISFS